MSVEPVIIVTGCGSGLGFALVRELLDRSEFRIVATARQHSLQLLRDAFGDNRRLKISELDITSDTQIHSVVNDVCLQWGRIDAVVNNAGVCFRSVVEHMDSEAEMIQLQTNYLGPMSLVRAVLPIMREQGRGHIINISSVSGMVAMPTMASYSASKQALEGATEALWYESRPYGVKVTLVQPGFINSDSFKRVLLSKKAEMSSRLQGPHSEYYESMAPFVESLMGYSFVSPEKIAKTVLHVLRMKRPPLRKAATPDALAFRILRWLLPASWFHLLMFNLLPGSRLWGSVARMAVLSKNVPVSQ